MAGGGAGARGQEEDKGDYCGHAALPTLLHIPYEPTLFLTDLSNILNNCTYRPIFTGSEDDPGRERHQWGVSFPFGLYLRKQSQ